MQVGEFLGRLQGVKRNGQSWLALCPAHEDRRQSLSIKADTDRILIHDFGGCPTEAVLDKLGLSWQDLFLQPNGHRLNEVPKMKGRLPPEGKAGPDPLQWLADYCKVPLDFLAGLPLAEQDGHIGFDFPTGVQKLRQAGSKSLFWEPPGSPIPPLWPFPEATLPETIWLCEGETDAIVARYLGLEAFALTRGAGSPLTHEQASALKQRGVNRANIGFDTDESGRQGAKRLAAALTEAGIEVGIVDLAEAGLVDPLRGEKDLRDRWVRDKEGLRGKLEQAAQTLPVTIESTRNRLGWEVDASELAAAGLPTEPKSLPLLGESGYIIEGWSHILAGYPKGGKTELLFACVRNWITVGVTLVWFSEESRSIWQERLSRHPDFPPGLKLVFSIGTDPQALLERAMNGSEQVVIVDTIRNLMGLADENDNAAIAKTLGGWEAALQGRTRIYVHHQRKMAGEHGQAIAGGGAFLGVVDRAIELKFDPQDKTRRQLLVHSRIIEAPNLLYELKDGVLQALGEPGAVELGEVKERTLEVLNGEWKTTKEVLEALEEPKPSLSQERLALQGLFKDEGVERDPAQDKPGATYRWRAVIPRT